MCAGAVADLAEPNVPDHDLLFRPAVELAALLRERRISAVELMEAHLRQIEQVNPRVNAIVTLLPEQAMAGAEAADAAAARGDALGPLHGLPIAHKDTTDTAGIRTTYGSPIYADHVPERDALIIARLRQGGAIAVGKTNVPEFGAGSHTFNPLFGPTLNPWDRTKTVGGSSGGAAAALVCGMHPIADGSDLGGSLRNPGGYCNVVGYRPSAGRVPNDPSGNYWFDLTTTGPLARTVADIALLLQAIAGPDPRVPVSLDDPGATFAAPLDRDLRGVRVAWSPRLGDLPVDPRTTAVLEAHRTVLTDLGCVVEEVDPPLEGADEVFETLRAWNMERGHGAEYDTRRADLKDAVVWNIEQGRKLSGPDVARAYALRSVLWERVQAFFDRYEFLCLPVSQLPPFDVSLTWPTEVAGVPMATYIEWMRTCSRITVTGHPCVSVPSGFTDEGLPVGLQIVGRHRADLDLLRIARAFERATGYWHRRPPVLA